jgi:hypothetical protein
VRRKFAAPAKVDHLDVATDGSVFITCGADVYVMKPAATE